MVLFFLVEFFFKGNNNVCTRCYENTFGAMVFCCACLCVWFWRDTVERKFDEWVGDGEYFNIYMLDTCRYFTYSDSNYITQKMIFKNYKLLESNGLWKVMLWFK